MSEKQQEKQKNKDTYMDPKLMERIGWSEEEIASYISSYSNFEEQEQQKKPRNPYKNRVQKVEVPAATTKMEVKKEKAGEKKEDAAVVIEDVWFLDHFFLWFCGAVNIFQEREYERSLDRRVAFFITT